MAELRSICRSGAFTKHDIYGVSRHKMQEKKNESAYTEKYGN
jgi:hypothetical protein